MSDAEDFMAEFKVIPLEDNDKNTGEEETELSTIIYCNDLSIADDEVDNDASHDNNVTKEVKPCVHWHGNMPRLSSERPENVTKEGECKTIETTNKDIAEHIKINPFSSSRANFSKLPVDQMKIKSLNDLPGQDHVVKVQGDHSSPEGLYRELPLDARLYFSQTGNGYSSRNKNSGSIKITDFVQGTTDTDSDTPKLLGKKLSKSSESYKSKEGSGSLTLSLYYGKGTERTDKKANEKRQSKGSTSRQTQRKRFRSYSRKFGKTYLVQQSPIYMLKQYADKKKFDFVKLMENADSMGLDVPFPCTECYLKKKSGEADAAYSNPINVLANLFDKQVTPMDKKCPDCGAVRMTLGSYGKMLYNLRQIIEYRDLLVHDVYPDGNCLYAAIVDQLRIRGDFTWSCNRLRTCAVAYLRENPHEEDGTHKKMYLDRETWEQYLERNSKDGEWGDHIMMSAIVEVLQRKIVILGGVSGMARNIIVPKSMCLVHTSKEGTEPTFSQPMDKNEDKKKEELEEGMEKKKNKEMRDEKGNEDKMEGKTKEEEDKETKNKKMREEAIQKKEKDDDDLEDETCLYLGHMSESHYISLRKRGWEKVLQEKMLEKTQRMKQQLKEENPDLFQMGDEIDYSKAVTEKSDIDLLTQEPFLHLDFTVKQMLEGYFGILSIMFQPMDNDMQTFELLGSQFERMYPKLLNGEKTLVSQYLTEDLLFCFPNSCEIKEDKIDFLNEDTLFYCTPRDTRVHEKCLQDVATASDLIEEPARNMCGALYLIPKKSKSWRGQLAENKDGKICLQHIHFPSRPISLSVSHGYVIKMSVRSIIAFKCQWPAEAAEWISRERPVNWPPANVIESIINSGCHVIPIAHGEPIQGMDAMTWEYTFRVAEKSLLCSSISEHQRTCFFIFRLLVDKQLQISESVPYQVLKNVFLFACETLGDKIWSMRPGLCILHMLSKLISYLDKGEAPMYFLPSKNLIQYVPRETTLRQAKHLEVLRLNPIISIYWLLDEYNLTSSDFGVTLDDVIEDLGQFAEHHNLSRSKTDLLLPASLETARDHLVSMEFSSAFQVVMNLYEELTDQDEFKDDMSIADFVKDNFSDVMIGYLWCFALYIDLNVGSNLVQDICLEYECKPVSYLFGPEIIEYVGVKPVPNFFANSWDQMFAKGVAIVLRSVQKYKAITVGLRYFLDTLEDFTVTENSFMNTHSNHSYFSSVVYLYIELFNAYCKCDEVAEFADLLERFEKMVFKLDYIEAYKHLYTISYKLGKMDLVKKAVSKVNEKYQSGNYTSCSCGLCYLTLPPCELDYEDDLPPRKSVVKKKQPEEKRETAASRPYGKYGLEKKSVSNDGNDLEISSYDALSSLTRLLASRSGRSPLSLIFLPPYDSIDKGGDSGNSA